MARHSRRETPNTRGGGIVVYSILTCLITWLFAAPAAMAWMAQQTPTGFAIACAGLSASSSAGSATIIEGKRVRSIVDS
jgi:hypothetical protein